MVLIQKVWTKSDDKILVHLKVSGYLQVQWQPRLGPMCSEPALNSLAPGRFQSNFR